jgi:hypothetical protein
MHANYPKLLNLKETTVTGREYKYYRLYIARSTGFLAVKHRGIRYGVCVFKFAGTLWLLNAFLPRP